MRTVEAFIADAHRFAAKVDTDGAGADGAAVQPLRSAGQAE